MSDLKHCPFCGGEATEFTVRDTSLIIAKCKKCKTKFGFIEREIEKAKERWNERK